MRPKAELVRRGEADRNLDVSVLLRLATVVVLQSAADSHDKARAASAATFANAMTHIDMAAKVKQQICMKCKRPKEPGHYIRAYEKVDGHWKPRANVCRYFDGEEAYEAAAKAKRAREVEAAVKKVAQKKARKEAQKNTSIQ